MVHGLGGAKENYWCSMQSPSLRDYTLISFDNPGTGNSTYYHGQVLSVDDLAEITARFIRKLKLKDFILTGTSMGGLTTLLYLKTQGVNDVIGYINIEGNLMPEDCMFSGKVVVHSFEQFAENVFPQTIRAMKAYANPGYHIIANNLQLNTDVRSYYEYSFQTVKYSSTGELLQQYIDLKIPRIFIYGERNSHLSYIPILRERGMDLKMIPESDHFVFYDNPAKLYEAMAEFANAC